MFDMSLQTRFAKSCADAMFGYSNATLASFSAVMGQTLDFWAEASRSAAGMTPPRTPAPFPAFPAYMQQPFNPFNPFNAWFQPASPPPVAIAAWPFAGLWNPAIWTQSIPTTSVWNTNPWLAAPAPATSLFAPFEAFWGMSPWRSAPVVWPMAAAMMSFGIPRAVAMPTAEANAAAFEAADTAVTAMKTAFSSYRSEGGDASAQVTLGKRVAAAAMLGPFGALSFWSSLAGARGFGF